MLEENYSEASKYFEKALSIDNNLNIALNGLVKCLYELKSNDKVLELIKDIEYTFDNISLQEIRALTLARIGENKKGIDLLERLKTFGKDNPEIMGFIEKDFGDVFKMGKEWQHAIDHYKKSLSLLPEIHPLRSIIEIKIKECMKELN